MDRCKSRLKNPPWQSARLLARDSFTVGAEEAQGLVHLRFDFHFSIIDYTTNFGDWLRKRRGF